MAGTPCAGAVSPGVGVVLIGRNEGERLVRCLASLSGRVEPVVYVDSGSTDGSVERASGAGAEVVELDPTRAFTAARARNAGFRRLLEVNPETRFVQFVDGDCGLGADWLDAARSHLEENEDVGVVCGRRRERNPGASVYNRLAGRRWEDGGDLHPSQPYHRSMSSCPWPPRRHEGCGKVPFSPAIQPSWSIGGRVP